MNRILLALLFTVTLLAQKPAPPEQEPAEEDKTLAPPKEYSFNPLQAEGEIKTGEFYFKKGNFKAASLRFREATKWNPQSAQAHLRLGNALEKAKDMKAAREAYAKYLELAPDAKNAHEIKKKL